MCFALWGRMKTNNSNENETVAALPLQVGVSSQQTQDVRDEISHSGVAQSEEDVENSAMPGPETSENDGASSGFPVPIVASD